MPADSNSGIDSPRAWIIVVASFFGSFVVFGVTDSFGVFLKPIATSFGVSHAMMTAIFSTLSVLSFFLAPITGDLADRIGPRYAVGVGALLMGIGLLLTARIYSFPLLFVTWGLCVGASVACVYIPAIAAVGEWFKTRRDIALGIAISGIGCGTLVAAPLARAANCALRLERCIRYIRLGEHGNASRLCRAIVAPSCTRTQDTANVSGMVRTPTFVLLYIALIFAGIAIYCSFVFLPAFAMDIGASHVAGAALVGYVGAASVVGRLGLNAPAPRFGLLNMYKATYWILLISCGIWLSSHTYPVLFIFALLMGVGYGGIAAMTPAVAAARYGSGGTAARRGAGRLQVAGICGHLQFCYRTGRGH
jgi:MFS family permease